MRTRINPKSLVGFSKSKAVIWDMWLGMGSVTWLSIETGLGLGMSAGPGPVVGLVTWHGLKTGLGLNYI